MKDFIRKKLIQELTIPKNRFRVPKPVNISDQEKMAIKNVNAEDLRIDDLGGNENIAHLKVSFPFDTQASEGIVVDIEVIQGAIYQIHIHMPDSLQGLGLGFKIYKAIIMDFGHLYSGKGRIHNPIIHNIWAKLEQTPGIECVKNEIGELCMLQNNPEKDTLLKFMN